MPALRTPGSPESWRPDIVHVVPDDAIPDALAIRLTTPCGNIEGDAPAVRVPYITDSDVGFVAESGVIPEDNPELNEVVIYTGKISQLVRISREQWRQHDTPNLIARSVSRSIVKSANKAFLAQVAPTTPAVTPPAGVLNIPGIVSGGEVEDNLDVLVDLMAVLEANGANPVAIVMDPLGWASLSKFKVGTGYNSTLLGAGVERIADTRSATRWEAQPAPTSGGVGVASKDLPVFAETRGRALLGMPVFVTPAMTPHTGLVVDHREILSVRGNIEVAQSEAVYFNTDEIAYRATWRFGHKLLHANRIGKFTVAHD